MLIKSFRRIKTHREIDRERDGTDDLHDFALAPHYIISFRYFSLSFSEIKTKLYLFLLCTVADDRGHRGHLFHLLRCFILSASYRSKEAGNSVPKLSLGFQKDNLYYYANLLRHDLCSKNT